LARPVTPDEYQAVARKIAEDIGFDAFDATTFEPHRLMFWPSTPKNGEFVFEYQDGPWLGPDKVLARYADWRDSSSWPAAPGFEKERKRLANRQGDPKEKPGMVGTFCKTYTVPEAIEKFLPDVYEPSGKDRYTYIHGTTANGVVIYHDYGEGSFAYSHHATDPASGKLLNAFDLVRVHKFGHLDEDAEPETPVSKLPSYQAMLEFASKDESVKETLAAQRWEQAAKDFEIVVPEKKDWLAELETDRRGNILPIVDNVVAILENDPNLAGKIWYNEFSVRPVIRGDLPWKKADPKAPNGTPWDNFDDSDLLYYLSRTYGIRVMSAVLQGFNVILGRHRWHPVKEYLLSLEWDGVPRIDTLLPDFMGAENDDYVRGVTKKFLISAVKRIFEPGCKADYVLVLSGGQGQKKSTFFRKLSEPWFNDSIQTVVGKEAMEQVHGSWIIEMSEMAAVTKRVDIEAVKQFITKQSDRFRPAYGRRVEDYPRQCVFCGTTNEKMYLRDPTGNRRFWTVEVAKQPKQKNLDELDRDQIWAEIMFLYQVLGEDNAPDPELEKLAEERQERHMEDRPKAGMIQEFLERLLPMNWDSMGLEERRNFLHNRDFDGPMEGTVRRDRVCAAEIWCELFQGDPKHLNPVEIREYHDIMQKMPGWKLYTGGTGKLRFPLYGPQRAYVRE
ncbi:MAG TPA: hypothetical protein GX517_15145, partial [Alicyclobacillus sp.]|nr:hypothetical protein [Alicyclobacillus sp.]